MKENEDSRNWSIWFETLEAELSSLKHQKLNNAIFYSSIIPQLSLHIWKY